MRVYCRRCGELYDEGFYSHHRVLPVHTGHVTYKQAKYGGQITGCDRCGDPYPSGEYETHKTTNVHRLSIKSGRASMRRATAIFELDRRDEYIHSRVLAGDSYGALATELGISRQRVHQIARKMGVASHAKRSSVTSIAKTCFFDNDIYMDWKSHSASKGHLTAEADFSAKVGDFRKSPSGKR